jgi:hypothetical protein
MPFQIMMEPGSKLAPLTVRVKGVVPPGKNILEGEIVLIEGTGGGVGLG